MKYDPDRIFLLLNRAHSRVGISQSDVEAVLGRTPTSSSRPTARSRER